MILMMEKYTNDLEDIVAQRTGQLQEEKRKTEALLYRMLPKYSDVTIILRPRVHKAFQNQDRDQAQVNNYFIMDFFKMYSNYLTIECRYPIRYILQTRLFGILGFFMKEKVNVIVATVMKS